MENDIIPINPNIIPEGMARLNITWGGSNGDLAGLIMRDLTDEQVKNAATEALRGGGIPGIPAAPTADLTNFVVERFEATEVRPFALIAIRPKTPLGA